jgi:hypothetical protein
VADDHPARFGVGADGEPTGMSTDAGSAAAPEDAATRAEAGGRPGLGSSDPQSADSATSTPDTADRGVEGSAPDDGRTDDTGAADSASTPDSVDTERTGDAGGFDPSQDGFVANILRDATITGMPGETGAPPAEPHAPQAQQEGDEPVGDEPPAGDNPRGAD